MAVQAHMAYLSQEAKERQSTHKERDVYLSRESDQPLPGRPGKAAARAAKIAGVNAATIYEAKRLSKSAETDPQAAEYAEQVKAGKMSVYRANAMLAAKETEGEQVAG